MKVGDSLTGVAIDAGFGEYSERACATLGIEQAPAGLKAGMEVMLQVPGGKQRARVTEMTDTSFTLDANHPLAGKKLELDVACSQHEPEGSWLLRPPVLDIWASLARGLDGTCGRSAKSRVWQWSTCAAAVPSPSYTISCATAKSTSADVILCLSILQDCTN